MNKKLLQIFALIMLAALMLAACGDSAEPAYTTEDIAQGEEFYAATCSACHGADAKGLPNLGKDLTSSDYVRDNTDEALLTLLKEGRPSGHELNTTGIDMPPKGGNPSLSDEDLVTIVAYLRSINE
jgi:mono/diheme cytochrome c family protein